MRILGISAYEGQSATFDIADKRVLGARLSTELSSFDNRTQDWDYVAYPHTKHFDEIKALVKPFTSARVVSTDYRESLAMSAICTRDWDYCAVMLVDSYYCALGYYTSGNFYWLREFNYPNSLSLFYSAATRFLGFDPLQESLLLEASLLGNTTYENIISERIINSSDGDYTVLLDLTRGIGVGPLNFDIARSVQAVFNRIVLSLAQWLAKSVSNKQLAYAGRSSANYQANTLLAEFSGFNDIAIQPLTSSAGAALGAAALIERPLWVSTHLGINHEPDISADTFAQLLMRGKILPLIAGREEISDTSFVNRNLIAIPFEDTMPEYRKQAKFKYSWQSPIVLCQERDYHTYYQGKHYPTFGQYLSYNKPDTPKFNTNYTRVVTTSISSNAYINRVLEITRASGYPILVSSPL